MKKKVLAPAGRRNRRPKAQTILKREVVKKDVKLTLREREVLWFLAEGRSNVNIARALGITEDTVRRHMSTILRKTGSTNRVQAALYAIRTGIAPLWPTQSA